MTGKNHLAKIVRPGCRLKARILGRLTSVIWLSLASPLLRGTVRQVAWEALVPSLVTVGDQGGVAMRPCVQSPVG